ncbi:MAG: Rieske 2Fe-2S domain-containing protein, partial [Gammaproteobacteria bacterium]|nr:Rieske 2Fe-2S domain-containing protein [Gammaproteobacteria bacterium]
QGVVNEETIQCCYHGWTYDCTGQCINIPYAGKSKKIPRGVKHYPCREAYGLIFVFPGEASLAESVSFPEISCWGTDKYKTRYLDDQVSCHYSFLHENLMDMNHQFLHRRIMSRIKTTFLELREGDNFVEVDYTFSRVGRQPMGEKVMLGVRKSPTGDRPKDLMTVRTEYPYQVLKFWTAGSTHPALDLWITYVPIDREQRQNHTFGLINVRKPAIPGLLDVLWPFIIWFTNGIFNEDRWVVEMEQEAFDQQGEDCNQEIFQVVLKVRDLLLRKGVPIAENPDSRIQTMRD